MTTYSRVILNFTNDWINGDKLVFASSEYNQSYIYSWVALRSIPHQVTSGVGTGTPGEISATNFASAFLEDFPGYEIIQNSNQLIISSINPEEQFYVFDSIDGSGAVSTSIINYNGYDDSKYTLTFKESGNSRGGGFTSFHSYEPDAMESLDNNFFSIKDGQLYRHYNEDNPVKLNFYGEQYSAKIVTIINDQVTDDKIFKTIVLESDKPLDVSVKTNYTESSISSSEFKKKESRYFAYIRKNEDASDLSGSVAQGIGNIQDVVGNTIAFNSLSKAISIGDNLYQSGPEELIGVITAINQDANTITVDAIVNTPITGRYSYSVKNARIEGSEIRGYYIEVELEYNGTDGVELYALNTNAVKSYV